MKHASVGVPVSMPQSACVMFERGTDLVSLAERFVSMPQSACVMFEPTVPAVRGRMASVSMPQSACVMFEPTEVGQRQRIGVRFNASIGVCDVRAGVAVVLVVGVAVFQCLNRRV